MNDYNKFTAMLASELHRYLMEDEEKARLLPDDALIIFQVEGEDDFNRWHKEMTLRNREANQSVTYVHLKKWRFHSMIEDMTLIRATA
ncbi:MAG: hypothetical protein KJ936_13795 [Proteobacteria bacterium]|nr:hypothetical protein [Pseudomonadota bacterium]MBU2262689.1 hypothetical protein [Pseudomonadota bacterium]